MKYLRAFNAALIMGGIDLIKFIRSIRGIPFYYRDFLEFKRQEKGVRSRFTFNIWPCLGDKFDSSGVAKGHYFHQDLLVARRIHLANPDKHVDIGSRVDGFVAHVASYRTIEVLDIRPLDANVRNIIFSQCDLMGDFDRNYEHYCDSLSCLHALEHFGLGRYGDEINYNGHIVGLDNLAKMLKKNGRLYLSVPIGPLRVDFNGHRVFSVRYLLDLFKGVFEVECFSFVDDSGDLIEDIGLDEEQIDINYGCVFGCGIFELNKI